MKTKTTISVDAELALEVRKALSKQFVAGEIQDVNVSALTEQLLQDWVKYQQSEPTVATKR